MAVEATSVSDCYGVTAFAASEFEKLVLRIRQCAERDGFLPFKCKLLPTSDQGSSNLINVIQFNDGVKWILRRNLHVLSHGPTQNWGPTEAEHMNDSIQVMNFIRNKTTVPIPEVYGFDVTCDNFFGCPYTVMECVPGKTLCTLLSENLRDPSKYDDILLTAINDLTGIIQQLDNVKFERGKFGRPIIKNDKIIGTGSFLRDSSYKGGEVGPFNDIASFFTYGSGGRSDNFAGFSRELINRFFLRSIAASTSDEATIYHPDLNARNIMVDNAGHITGVLDWDGVSTGPSCLNIGSYPRLVAEDWYWSFCPCEEKNAGEVAFDAENAYKAGNTFDYYNRLRLMWRACMSMRERGIDNASMNHLRKSIDFEISCDALDEAWISPLQLKDIADNCGFICYKCHESVERLLRMIYFKHHKFLDGLPRGSYYPVLNSLDHLLKQIETGTLSQVESIFLKKHFGEVVLLPDGAICADSVMDYDTYQELSYLQRHVLEVVERNSVRNPAPEAPYPCTPPVIAEGSAQRPATPKILPGTDENHHQHCPPSLRRSWYNPGSMSTVYSAQIDTWPEQTSTLTVEEDSTLAQLELQKFKARLGSIEDIISEAVSGLKKSESEQGQAKDLVREATVKLTQEVLKTVLGSEEKLQEIKAALNMTASPKKPRDEEISEDYPQGLQPTLANIEIKQPTTFRLALEAGNARQKLIAPRGASKVQKRRHNPSCKSGESKRESSTKLPGPAAGKMPQLRMCADIVPERLREVGENRKTAQQRCHLTKPPSLTPQTSTASCPSLVSDNAAASPSTAVTVPTPPHAKAQALRKRSRKRPRIFPGSNTMGLKKICSSPSPPSYGCRIRNWLFGEPHPGTLLPLRSATTRERVVRLCLNTEKEIGDENAGDNYPDCGITPWDGGFDDDQASNDKSDVDPESWWSFIKGALGMKLY